MKIKRLNGQSQYVETLTECKIIATQYANYLDSIVERFSERGFAKEDGESHVNFIDRCFNEMAERCGDYDANNHLKCLNTINAMDAMLNDEGFERQPGIDVPTYVQASLESLLHEREVGNKPKQKEPAQAPAFNPSVLDANGIRVHSVCAGDESPSTHVYTHHNIEILVNSYKKVIHDLRLVQGEPIPAPAPAPASAVPPTPLVLKDGAQVMPVWFGGEWYFEIGAVMKKIADVSMATYNEPIAMPLPFVIDEDRCINPTWDAINGVWVTPFSNLDEVFKALKHDAIPEPESAIEMTSESQFACSAYKQAGWTEEQLVDAGFAKWITPPAPAPVDIKLHGHIPQHISFPPSPDGGVRKSISSTMIQGESVFYESDVIECFDAWEKSDSDLLSSLNVLRELLDAKGLGYEATVDLAIQTLASMDELEPKPGTVVMGDKMVLESLANQWIQIYKTVHGSAGGTCDNATEAAHNFIELIKE